MDANSIGSARVAPMIWTICTPIILTIGIVGNTLTILVLNRRTKTSSTTVYLTAMATADLIYVFFGLPRWVILYNFNYDVRISSVFVCKTHLWMLYALGTISSSFLIVLTIERVLSLTIPYKVRMFCSVNRSVIICVVVVLFWFAFHAHVLYGFDLRYIKPVQVYQENSAGNVSDEVDTTNSNVSIYDKRQISNNTDLVPQCVRIDNKIYNQYYNEAQGFVTFTTYNGMTMVVCFTAGIYIVWKLMKNNRIRKSLNLTGRVYDNRTNQVTIMLLTVNVVFFVCSTPVAIFLIGRSHFVDKEMTATQEILWAVFNMMHYLNHAINFILYFLSGTRFRKTFFDFFNCGRSGKPSNELSTSKVASIGAGESVSISYSATYASPI